MKREISAQDARQGNKRPNILIVLVVSMLLFGIGWVIIEYAV